VTIRRRLLIFRLIFSKRHCPP